MSATEKKPDNNLPTPPSDSPTKLVSSLEVEVKFAVDDSTPVPDLSTITGVAAVQDPVVHELSAVYFDTADLRLTRNKITLRRRTGGKDAGWHVKLPATEGGRKEIHAPLGEYEFTPPKEIAAVIRPFVRAHDVDPIAQIDNERHEYILLDEGGAPVVEFVDDHVTAYSLLPGGDISVWREWEVELTDPTRGTQVLVDAGRVLTAAGAKPAKSPSKLVAALGESVNNAPPLAQPEAHPAQLDAHDPAAKVIAALVANRNKIIALDGPVRDNAFDSVHQMRVATRELRSHLSTFDGILVGDHLDHLGTELKHMAQVLGHARDAEVVAARFAKTLDTQEPEFLDDEVTQRLTRGMEELYAREHALVVEFLDSDRYAQLLDDLDEVLANPPVAEHTPDDKPKAREKAAADVLMAHLDKALCKVERLHLIVEQKDTPTTLAQREQAYHDLRKAVKKLRYSVEAVGAVSGVGTKKLYRACSWAQDVLGEFQDTVTARETLAAVAQRAHTAGEDTFLYGMLYQQERDNGLVALRDYPDAMEAVFDAYESLLKKQAKKAKKARKAEKAKAKAAAKAQAEAEAQARAEAEEAKAAAEAEQAQASAASADEIAPSPTATDAAPESAVNQPAQVEEESAAVQTPAAETTPAEPKAKAKKDKKSKGKGKKDKASKGDKKKKKKKK